MTHEEFVAAVNKLGGSVELNNQGRRSKWDYNVDAPIGHTWDGDLHCFVAGYSDEDRDDCISRIKQSHMEKCALDCEYCYPTEN